MRGISLPVVVTGAVLAIASASPGRSLAEECPAKQCRENENVCKAANTKPCTCTVNVRLGVQQGKCAVENMQTGRGDLHELEQLARHQVQVCSGDTVVWEFTNKCKVDLALRISDFRVDAEIAKRERKELEDMQKEARDAFPLDPKCKNPVSVAHEKSDKLTCKIIVPVLLEHPSARGRTYKYDIVWQGGASGKLDPEMEIYR